MNENNINNQVENVIPHKKTYLVYGIVLLVIILLGITYGYFSISGEDDDFGGNMGNVDLSLSVTKQLPNKNGVDDILIIGFDELADSLNSGCLDEDGEFALCQLYKVTLSNSANGINIRVKGSIAFDDTNTSNLSWILLGNSYSASTNYTSSMLGNTFKVSSSDFVSFEDSYLLEVNSSVTYYILVWINETEEIQSDLGTYGGVVKFEDANGKGISASFGDYKGNYNG